MLPEAPNALAPEPRWRRPRRHPGPPAHWPEASIALVSSLRLERHHAAGCYHGDRHRAPNDRGLCAREPRTRGLQTIWRNSSSAPLSNCVNKLVRNYAGEHVEQETITTRLKGRTSFSASRPSSPRTQTRAARKMFGHDSILVPRARGLEARRACLRAHRSGSFHYRNHARRKLEDSADGGPLQRRSQRRTRGRQAVSVNIRSTGPRLHRMKPRNFPR